MIKGMLSVNGKISRDMSHNNTMWLRKPELKVKGVFNQQISRSWKLLVEVTGGLSKEGSREINKQEDKRESAFDRKIDLQSQNVSIGW